MGTSLHSSVLSYSLEGTCPAPTKISTHNPSQCLAACSEQKNSSAALNFHFLFNKSGGWQGDNNDSFHLNRSGFLSFFFLFFHSYGAGRRITWFQAIHSIQ